MRFTFNDGGRQAAGFKGTAGDCVVRAVAIASGRPYAEVYNVCANGNATERITKRSGRAAGMETCRYGVSVSRKWFKDYMRDQGFVWVPTMRIGSGCQVHLRAGELPLGRLVVCLSRHYTAVINSVIHDRYDPSRDGTRCVYGYWRLDG